LKSLRTFCDLCASAVNVFEGFFTAETQRSQRLLRENLKPGHHQ
jgi:hypothetical protein